MKKLFIIFLSPLFFLFYGASMDNLPISIGPCFLFSCYKTDKNINEIKKEDNHRLHKEFNIEAGKTLNIDLNSGGAITVLGWDKNVLSADVESSHNNLDDYNIEFNVTKDGIDVSSKNDYNSNSSSLGFTFQVPSHFNLHIETMGGSVTIKNVNGEIEGKTMGGALVLTKLKGNLDLETMGGAIKLSDSEVDGRVHTMGGPVEITNVKGSVKGTTNGGPVIMKNVTSKDGSSSGDVFTVSSMGGNINVDEAPSGADLKTMGGAITVKSAKKFVKAKTMGGSIEIENTDGSIDASTMGGDINAEVVGNPNDGNKDVTLSSKAGDITLVVPNGLSMDIDITLAYTKNNEGDYKIYSDFPISQETTPEWSHKHGTARKFIYGKGKTGDGKNKIKIETINGNVYLKKG